MSTTDIPADAGESTGAATDQPTGQEPTFTQADVDRIVKERAERIAKQRFADYDDLKAKAGESKTLEERLADVESRYQRAEVERIRAEVAATYQIGKEDRDLFLTGADEDTLTAQAKRLAQRESERKLHGNVAPREGGSTNTGQSDGELRDFARSLFAQAD